MAFLLHLWQRSRIRIIPGLALLLLVGACTADDGPPPGCPTADFVSDLDHLTVFTNGAVGDLTDVRFDARFDSLGAVCNFERGEVVMDIAFRVIATQGPADRENRADVSYFLAIADETGTVIAKEIFSATLPFSDNRRRVAITDEFAPRIPWPADPRLLDGYRVLIGFQLTPEQFAYNRSRKR